MSGRLHSKCSIFTREHLVLGSLINSVDLQMSRRFDHGCGRGVHLSLFSGSTADKPLGEVEVKLTRPCTTFISDYTHCLWSTHFSTLAYSSSPQPFLAIPRVIFRSLQPQGLSRNQPGWIGEKAWVQRRPRRGGEVLWL